MRIGLGGGIGDVIGADDEGHVAGAELAVDVLQLEHLIVGHIGLGQQDVHVAGHAAGDGVDGVFDLDPLLLELVGHFAKGVLGLGDGHAIAGDDDDLGGIFHDEGSVVGRALFDRAGLGDPGARRATVTAEAAEDDRDEAAVHALAHDVAEDGAGAADEGAGDDQGDVLERETQRRRGPAGIAVEHGDHDRHVGAADRDDQGGAEDQGQREHPPEGPGGGAARPHHDADQQDEGEGERDVDQMAGGQQDRRAAHVSVQLGKGDHRAGEGDGADGDAEAELDDRQGLDAALGRGDAEGHRGIDGADRDQTGGQTDQTVEGGDQLGHLGHLHARGDQGPGPAADDHPARDQGERQRIQRAGDAEGDQGDGNGEAHPDHAEGIAPPAGLGTGEPAQGQDEQNTGSQIGQGGKRCGHGVGPHERLAGQGVIGPSPGCGRGARGRRR